MNKKKLIPFVSFLFLLRGVQAHCPLCTAGAAIAAGGAVYLGIHPAAVSLFIGAFSVSTGWWMSNWRWFKKRRIPFQKSLIVIGSFVLTVLPILPVLESKPYPLYFSFLGEYGLIYLLNLSLIGSILGGLLVSIAPWLSRKLSSMREGGRVFPFQGVMITLGLLLIASILIQVTF